MNWFYTIDDEVVGPLSKEKLMELRTGGTLDADTQVCEEGSDDWIRYEDAIEKKAPSSRTTPDQSPTPEGDSPTGATNHLTPSDAARHTKSVVSDLRAMDFKREIIPLDADTFAILRKDFVFWSVALMGVVPLFLVTLSQTDVQLAGFCLFFAILWGFIFKKFIIDDDGGWRIPLASMLFTGIVGINLLLFIYKFLPQTYVNLPNSPNLIAMTIGSIFQTGICEELCKIVPVFGYLLWKRKAANPLTIIVVGVFSGLGFAAFENVTYAQRAVMRSAVLTDAFGAEGLQAGVQGAMVNVMLRSMSSVFGHAIYSGIFSYFIALAFVTKERVGALVLVGLLVAATVHGSYNAFWSIQTTVPAMVTVVAFMLFYAYLTKLRLILSSRDSEATPESTSTPPEEPEPPVPAESDS